MSEHNEQAAVVNWFNIKYAGVSHFLMSYPSGTIIGGKNKWGAIAKFKKEGWKKGIPDLFLAIPKGENGGLWIEMKDKNKSEKNLSDEQKFYLHELSRFYKAIWCSGADEAIKAIEEYLHDSHT